MPNKKIAILNVFLFFFFAIGVIAIAYSLTDLDNGKLYNALVEGVFGALFCGFAALLYFVIARPQTNNLTALASFWIIGAVIASTIAFGCFGTVCLHPTDPLRMAYLAIGTFAGLLSFFSFRSMSKKSQ